MPPCYIHYKHSVSYIKIKNLMTLPIFTKSFDREKFVSVFQAKTSSNFVWKTYVFLVANLATDLNTNTIRPTRQEQPRLTFIDLHRKKCRIVCRELITFHCSFGTGNRRNLVYCNLTLKISHTNKNSLHK